MILKKILKPILWLLRIVLTIIILLLISAMGISAILAGILEKIIRTYKRFIVQILMVFKNQAFSEEGKPIGTINERVKSNETIVAVLKNVKTGEKKVIRERWYHKILGLLK